MGSVNLKDWELVVEERLKQDHTDSMIVKVLSSVGQDAAIAIYAEHRWLGFLVSPGGVAYEILEGHPHFEEFIDGIMRATLLGSESN